MGNLIESMINGLYKHANFYSVQGTACVRMYNIQDGQLDLCKLQRIDLTDDELQHYLLEATDLVVNRVNSRELVGKAAVVGDQNEPLIFEAMNIRVRFLEKENLPAYANLLLRTDPVRMSFQTDAKQASGQASISQPQVANIAIPLPPLAEQTRIVTKVTELLSLCDALEAKLNQAESASTQLLSAAVHQLLNGAATNV